MKRRPIATRYAALVVALLSAALIASGTVETWVSHRERQAALEALQREKAQAAANEVSRFVDDVLRSLDWVTLSAAPAGEEHERRRLDFLKLLRLEPAITTATLVDAEGRERLRVSRIKPDRLASDIDLSGEPGFIGARRGRAHFGDVYFVAETEPYLTIGTPSAARDGSVVLAEVNLKFVWNVVSGIRIGTTGYAYVVDAHGRLVSHPDISRVLQMTDLSRLPQVNAASGAGPQQAGFAGDGRDPAGVPVLSAYAKIAPLNWTVFVEQPRAEAFAPLAASIARSAVILLVALALAVTAGVVAARRMVAPIGELRRGAQRFGAGDLAHRIEVASGDELQELAAQFNAMGDRLRENYESLERRVAERTRDLNERNAEITEALEQQTATAEILRVISASPTDVGPVFRTIVESATRLCDANFAAVFLVDNGRIHAPAHTPVTPAFADFLENGFPVNRGSTSGRAALERKTVQIVDVLADPEFELQPAHQVEGLRTILSVPMLHNDEVIGLINVWRREVRPFSDKQIKLLETFARQAVIAIDNVRLFRELETRNRELGEALEQQTATAEVLRVISSSPSEAAPVFDSIVRNAARLCNANFAFVMLDHDGWLSLAARTDCTAEFAAFLERGFPADRHTTSGRAASERRPVQILDFLGDPDTSITPEHRAEEIRTVLAVPMLRDGRVLGVIAIWRREVRAFSDKQIRLLQTFADQAVIAVENLRLFNEIQETSRQLDLANQAKSRFLAAASHDLRQPMHALSLFVGQLRASRSAAERSALAQRIEAAVGGLSTLLDQLLDLSKLEAGAVQAEQEHFALAGTMAAIEAQFAPLARAKGLALRMRAPRVHLRSDPLLVQRILLNLVANAIRYTERGGVLIGCRRRGDRLRIAVWDTGCGIPEAQRDNVFREFVQLGAPERRPATAVDPVLGRGLGLGLAIVARLADLLGTRIELASRLGRGSMFAFELPLGSASAARAAAPAPPLRVASLRGTFALVVDDDEAARTGTCGLLESWGCVTLAAASGAQALAQLPAHDRAPELIVCDYRLGPDEDGLTAIARIRAQVGCAVPAVLVTADTAPATLHAAQASGVPMLHKPVSPVKLRALLAQLLGAGESRKAA
jgi:signal transduction histidine kinase